MQLLLPTPGLRLLLLSIPFFKTDIETIILFMKMCWFNSCHPSKLCSIIWEYISQSTKMFRWCFIPAQFSFLSLFWPWVPFLTYMWSLTGPAATAAFFCTTSSPCHDFSASWTWNPFKQQINKILEVCVVQISGNLIILFPKMKHPIQNRNQQAQNLPWILA